MNGDAQRSGRSGRNPVLMEIGRHLAAMYEGYVDSPLPERFELLLSQLDEQECGSSDRNRHRWLAGRLKEGLTSRPKC
jgi:Anti-sigma factor NepR